MFKRLAAMAVGASVLMLCFNGLQRSARGTSMRKRRLAFDGFDAWEIPNERTPRSEVMVLGATVENPKNEASSSWRKSEEKEVEEEEEQEEVEVEEEQEEVEVEEEKEEDQEEDDHFSNGIIQLLEDGTLVVQPMAESTACSYFTSLPNVPRMTSSPPNKLVYHFPKCSDTFLGMHLADYYGHYLLANAAQIPFEMTCGNGGRGGEGTVLKMLQHRNRSPGQPPVDNTGHVYSVFDVCHACYGLSWWCERGPELMVGTFQEEMWKLANSDLGQTVEEEDAVVYVRLGNALEGGRDKGLGLLPFRAYSRLLRRVEAEAGSLETISVVTHPFDERSIRKMDVPALERSKMIADDFVAHLREYFPDADVRIHNSRDDTPLVAFVRMIKARKVAICGASTFCTYPVLANTNIRYVFHSDKLNRWVDRLRFAPSIRAVESPRLANNYIGALTDEQLKHWLRHQNPNGNDVIVGPPLFRVPKTLFEF